MSDFARHSTFNNPSCLGTLWVSHGTYQLKGVADPVEVCELGDTERSTLTAPKTSEKAQRRVRPDEEPVLGWRPAVGQDVPNTPWVLEEKLGEGGFGEVWTGRHRKLKERRVFKFCFRADRVQTLKRELTLFRLLKEHVGDHPNIVWLHEVYLEQPPYYLEEEFVEGNDLDQSDELGTLGHHSNFVTTVTFSPDATLLASTGWDTTVRVWDCLRQTNVVVLTNHTAWVSSLAFSPDGKTLVSAGADQRIRLSEHDGLAGDRHLERPSQ